jgi:KaiC/GvpD/RAD55 family RecA-like ATPase
MDGSAETATPVPSGAPAEELARNLGVSSETGRRLFAAGVTSPEAARSLNPSELMRLVPDAAERGSIRGVTEAAAAAPQDADQIVEKWAGSVRRPERARRHRVTVAPKDSAAVLKKWVDGDDRVMEDWIRASDQGRPAPAVPAPVSAPSPSPSRPLDLASAAPVLEREETVVRWLTGLLDRVKSDQFDPSTMIQEVQDLQRQLYDERTKRKQLEDEVEHVKRGSIAVIKYVRGREAKEREIALRAKDDEIAEMKLRLLALEGVSARPAAGSDAAPTDQPLSPLATADAVEKAVRELDQRLREEFGEREHEYIERETELRRRIVQLEGEVRNLAAENERAEEHAQLLGKEAGPLAEDVARRLGEVAQREKDLVARENELRTKFEEIRINAEEVERRRGPLEFKERELAAFDQQLTTRRQALDIEARRLEEIRREVGASGISGSNEAQRLEDLRHELSKKETELRAREGQLRERIQELEKMAGRAAEVEADRMHADSVAAAAETKVKSGVRRLDDLLYGGFPVGAQVLMNGAAHTGKDTLARLFSVEGLKVGVPSIWIVTDKTYGQVREDLAGLYPGLPDAEKKGMLRWVDLYSRSVGSTASAAGVRLLSSTDKTVLDQLAQTVNGFAEELKETFQAYRLIFESVSTLTAYLDSSATFRFLQPFVGRRKIEGAVSYYVLDSGMHSESDLETLEHMVDGSINLKVEQMKTFLSVRGIGEAQARTWVGYTFTKRSFNLGSFSLEHIR